MGGGETGFKMEAMGTENIITNRIKAMPNLWIFGLIFKVAR